MIYNQVQIENYRGISRCRLEGLAQLNVFFGKNNCGKSSLLEAIFLLSGPANPTLALQMNMARLLNNTSPDNLKATFHNANPQNPITLSAQGNPNRKVTIRLLDQPQAQLPLDRMNPAASAAQNQRQLSLEVNFADNDATNSHHARLTLQTGKHEAHVQTDPNYQPPFDAAYMPPGQLQANDLENLKLIIQNKQEQDLIQTLRIVEPRIRDIQVVGQQIMVDIGLPLRLPVNVLGDGVRRVLSIVMTIKKMKHGAVMIDEMDNGLHFSVLKPLWNAIIAAAQQADCQLFASTHSIDLIKALVQALADEDEHHTTVAAYKLVRTTDDQLIPLKYNNHQLAYAIEQEMEVR